MSCYDLIGGYMTDVTHTENFDQSWEISWFPPIDFLTTPSAAQASHPAQNSPSFKATLSKRKNLKQREKKVPSHAECWDECLSIVRAPRSTHMIVRARCEQQSAVDGSPLSCHWLARTCTGCWQLSSASQLE